MSDPEKDIGKGAQADIFSELVGKSFKDLTEATEYYSRKAQSHVELLVLFLIGFVYQFTWLISNLSAPKEYRGQSFLNFLQDPFTILLYLIIIVEYFFYLIYKNTLYVKLLNRRRPKVSRPTDAGGNESVPSRMGNAVTEQNSVEPSSRDHIERVFISYLDQTRSIVNYTSSRPNALLFIGGLVAVGGLVFFFFTLPSEILIGKEQADIWDKFLERLINIVPRLLMLIFIQVLAGFFLKQYRNAVEDFRYYESVQRLREDTYISYLIKRENGTKEELSKFSDSMLMEKRLGILKKGETSSTHETDKISRNDFLELNSKLVDAIKSTMEKPRQKMSGPKKNSATTSDSAVDPG